jgi:hypothetical protein
VSTVAALYVETNGCYFGLPDVVPWDVSRDARLYDGPWPVVAHPPCGPYSRLKHLCTKQDPSCAPRAVEQVRSFGGVLEHPQYSDLFKLCRLPYPGELPDAHGGRTFEVRQLKFGHGCEKPTWLYVVRAEMKPLVRELVAAEMRHARPTHRMTNGPRGPSARTDLVCASGEMRRRTPVAFRDFLLSIARSVRT